MEEMEVVAYSAIHNRVRSHPKIIKEKKHKLRIDGLCVHAHKDQA